MKPLFRSAPQEHFIDDGRVYCPMSKRDVEFDLCAGCRWAKDIDVMANPPVVRCEPRSPPEWLIRPWR